MDLKAIVSPESTAPHDDPGSGSYGSLSDANNLPPLLSTRTITYSPSPVSPEPSGSSALPSPKLSPASEDEPHAYYTTKPELDKRSLSAPSIPSIRPHDGRIDTHSARPSSGPIPAKSSSSSSSSSLGSSRRFAHILSEQRRRENINGGFLELKGSIPQCRGTQDSKAVILQKAVVYISSLELELNRVKSELYACQQQQQQQEQEQPQQQQDKRQHAHQPVPRPQPQQQPTAVRSEFELSPGRVPARIPSLAPPPLPQMYVHASPPMTSLPPPPPPQPPTSAPAQPIITPVSHPVAFPYMHVGQYYTSYPAPHHSYAVPMPPPVMAAWKVPSAV
ncbi:hypothetical protein V1509DRAFT_616876 [Lipomyces kononenkoae]